MFATIRTLWPPSCYMRFALPFHKWRGIRWQRNNLLDLNDHLLKDIGLTRDQARIECIRPFWDA